MAAQATPLKTKDGGGPSSQPQPSTPARPAGPPPPQPVIPTSWLQPHEQRLLFASIFGLLETIKVWDIISPYFPITLDPTWSSALRVRSLPTAAFWSILETSLFILVALLRIPNLSPSGPRMLQLVALILAWNALCWIVAEPGMFWVSVNLFGPPALGTSWYLAWWPWVKGLMGKEEGNISGVHQIRLLPYSTATFNPLSLSYCIPQDAQGPVYIPIVFNNSVPEEVSYFVRSLDTGHAEVKSVPGSLMKSGTVHRPVLAITDSDDDDATEPEVDPLSALVLRNGQDLAKLPSIKPADSLAMAPRKLARSENMLFIAVDRPSVVSLKRVSDKRGDRFHIAPHKEAVIIECPIGGDAMEHRGGKMSKRKKKVVESRCVGNEDIVHFEVRGVGTLKAGWKKRSKDGDEHGVIEGIEDDVTTSDELGLVRRDKVARTHIVPLRIKHDKPGTSSVWLTSISDSMHNTYTPSQASQREFNVVARPTARFDCSSPVSMLSGGKASLPFTVEAQGGLPPDVSLLYGYKLLDGRNGTGEVPISKNKDILTVSEAGTYTLLQVGGECAGSIMEPSSCLVTLIPQPTMEMSVTTLHECAMDVGVTAEFDFSGTPPFTVDFTEQRRGAHVTPRNKQFHSRHGEIVLQPQVEGEYTYKFVSLSDKNYKVPLDRAPITQTVHPLAHVSLTGSTSQQLYACSGDKINVNIDAQGIPPLRLNYLVDSSNATVEIPIGRSKFSVPVPKHLAAGTGNVGKFSVILASIEDGNGCLRRLPAPSVDVSVDRQKPTARFAKSERVVVVEGEQAKAAVRLTGQAPWSVVYARDGSDEIQATLRDANNHLTLQDPGVYRLLRVADAKCPGSILDSESTFEVAHKPRPQVYLMANPAVTQSGREYRHNGLCEEEEGQIAIRFQGDGPYELVYRHTREGSSSRHVLKSAQETGILHLATEPGYHRYDFSDLRDANYPSTPVTFSLEHEVFSRPSGSFVRLNTHPICLDNQLQGDAKIRLKGKAPFKLGLTVRKPTSRSTHEVEVYGDTWVLDLPQTLTEIGRHEVTITSLSDASGCAWTVHAQDQLSVGVEVVESARIVPVSQAEDLCVGDTLDFLLQGKAPWTIGYEWLGKRHEVTSSAARFSRYAEERGLFAVTSVALKNNQCKREITNLVRRIHPLPSVRIQEGLDHLREGDEPAAFSVHFTGTPPYTFTYTRSEVQVPGGRARVVETQTVTDIMSDEYTISSSLPGDYQVTSVSDKYCRYPPIKARRDS